MSILKIGWAEVNITPDKKISLAGQFAERISEYVEKPLTATALAVSNEEDQMVLVSVDLSGVSYQLVTEVRNRLAANTVGLDPDKVVFCAIHTHTGPVYPRETRIDSGVTPNRTRMLLMKELPAGRTYIEQANITANPEIATPQEVMDLLLDRLTEVTLQAWENRKPGSFSNAFGRAVVGHCRRAVYSDGSAQMWGDTNTAVFTELEAGNDTGIELMYLMGESGELTGIVANIACPAQCVQHRHFVSPDYWGEVKMLLRKEFGEDLFLLPLCGIAGDQCPVDLVRWVEPDSDLNDPNCTRTNPPKRKADPSMFDLSGMRKVGKRVANEIIEVYREGLGEARSDAVLMHQVHVMQLPIRRATLTDVAEARTAIRDYLRDNDRDLNYIDVARLQRHLGVLCRAEIQEKHDTLDTEVHIIRLGPIAIATNPFEPFLAYGNQIKARSLAEQTFVVQLANGLEGYLPTEKAEKGGHYSAFIAGGQVGHIGGEQLVRETLKDINGMFSK